MMKESEKLAMPDRLKTNGLRSQGAGRVQSSQKDKQVRSIRKQNNAGATGRPESSADEVLVENRQETVSCIFYPYKQPIRGRQSKQLQG